MFRYPGFAMVEIICGTGGFLFGDVGVGDICVA